jgi:hypothetical protein
LILGGEASSTTPEGSIFAFAFGKGEGAEGEEEG